MNVVLVRAEESRSQPPQRLGRQKDDQGGEDARGRDGAILNRPQHPVGHLAALFAHALPGAAYEIAGLQPVLEGAGGGGALPPRLFHLSLRLFDSGCRMRHGLRSPVSSAAFSSASPDSAALLPVPYRPSR